VAGESLWVFESSCLRHFLVKEGFMLQMTTEQALRKEVAVLHKRNAGLKKRIRLFTTTCEKRKEALRKNHRFLVALKQKNPDLYAEVVAEFTGKV
jgi:general stress protein 26